MWIFKGHGDQKLENHVQFLWSPCDIDTGFRFLLWKWNWRIYSREGNQMLPVKVIWRIRELIPSSHLLPGTQYWTQVDLSLSQCFDFDTTRITWLSVKVIQHNGWNELFMFKTWCIWSLLSSQLDRGEASENKRS